jgi:hypothetical protein
MVYLNLNILFKNSYYLFHTNKINTITTFKINEIVNKKN